MMREDWIEVEFSNIAINLKRRPFGGNLKKEFFVSSGYKVYEQKHAINKDYTLGSYFINDQKYRELQGFAVEANDYIISCSGTIGKLYRLPPNAPNGVINQALLKIKIQDKLINHSYFSLLFESEYFQRKILSDARGTGMQNLAGMKEIKLVTLPLAPLPEQRAIAAKIEQLFSELDNGIANLKAAKSKLEIYRQAILKQAFEGKLTEQWREKESKNHGNHVNQKNHSTDNLPETWKWVKFEDITISFDGKRKPLSSTFRQDFKGVFPYYGACDIIDYVKEYIFDGEYLLIGEDGANLLSKSKPLSFIARGKFWVNNHAHIVKTIDNVNIKYLNYQFNSLQINEYVTGTAQPKLSQRNLYKIPIALPLNLQEQNQIVQEIETRLSVCDKLNESIDQSLEKAQALRQSILKKAFEGKLLSQDELQTCRQQTDWEPAAKLLEKVKKDSKTKR